MLDSDVSSTLAQRYVYNLKCHFGVFLGVGQKVVHGSSCENLRKEPLFSYDQVKRVLERWRSLLPDGALLDAIPASITEIFST